MVIAAGGGYSATVMRSYMQGMLGQAAGLARWESLMTMANRRRFVMSLGDAGRVVVDLAEENELLKVEMSKMKLQLPHFRPLKRRSPARWRFRVDGWELGTMEIRVAEQGDPKTIRRLRLFVPLEDKAESEPWWDLTSATLIAQLLPLLPRLAGSGAYLAIEHHGAGFGSWYSVKVEPA